jgi:cobalt-zinc-cadmium resistance protein CzcA
MIRLLIGWALDNPLVVILLSCGLVIFGVYAFQHVNVEAYPDPAPPLVEVIAQFSGASAEEVERQVTVPLEVTLSGMPGLTVMRSKSLFGLSDIHCQFAYGTDYLAARQEVINRLQFTQPLPPGVQPVLSPESPTGEIYRYTLNCPKDPAGNDIYSLNDLKALQDWVLERQFRRVPGIIDVSSSGGTVKRYEIHPDPDKLRLYGITLQQLQNAIANSNANVGGGLVKEGPVAFQARSVGLFGGGLDPASLALEFRDPVLAAAFLRDEDNRRINDIRELVITSVNNKPIRVEHVVEGSDSPGEPIGEHGVVVGNQERLGRIGLSTPKTIRKEDGIYRVVDSQGRVVRRDENDKVQCIVLLRKGADSLPVLKAVEKKVEELNTSDSSPMLPGVKIEPYYDRTELINITTETVRENLVLGMVLVTIILLMFLSNVRSALIVAVNIPMALLFAFSVLYLRGKSANLLSIGAVDFGIIVDSSVIMVENVYRHLSAHDLEHAELPLKERILRACHEVERALFFSTAIMVCAFIPLFTMSGPEGQIFGPMADTYAFALGGALILALTLAPVLCLLFFRNLKPADDNFMVRWLKRSYLRQLERFLNHRVLTLGFFGLLILGTAAIVFVAPGLKKQYPEELAKVPTLGFEFMPELEEGNLWIRGTFPLNISLDRITDNGNQARAIMASYPEVETVVVQLGRPDDGTDSDGFYNSEFFVPLQPQKDWPAVKDEEGWRRMFSTAKRPRTKDELIKEMSAELTAKLPGANWNFSQNIRDNVMESLSGVKGDNSVKIFGPDLDKLDDIAIKLKERLQDVKGMENVGVFSIKGATNLEFRVDPEKCKHYGVAVADVNNVIGSALGAQASSTMIEGEKLFDIAVRWPKGSRGSVTSILDIFVDVTNNTVAPPPTPNFQVSSRGTMTPPPAIKGNPVSTENPLSQTPRVPLRELVSPVGKNGAPDPKGQFVRAGASTIYREQGNRHIAVKFSVRGRDLGSAVAEAKEKTHDLFQGGYHAEWSGEFQEMEEAFGKLMYIIPASLALIFGLLYFAFRSVIDACLVLINVVALSLGGIWALLLTNTNFSISAAVGFISIFGVAIMDGLLLVAYFNQLRARGLPLKDAIMQGAEKRVRPVMMTALTAIFGLLPAAFSTRIGAQTQRPLAIVVVGGMIATLLLTRYLMPVLYSFYGHREPPAGSGGMAH